MRLKEHLVPLILFVVLAVTTFVALLIDADVRRQAAHRAQLHLERGIRLYNQKSFPRAEFELRRALRINRNEWKIPFYMGAVKIERKMYGEAIPYLEFALTHNPEEPKILNALGLAYFKMGRLDMAKGYYTASIELDPTNVGARGLLETMAKLQRRAENASGEAKDQAHVRPKHH